MKTYVQLDGTGKFLRHIPTDILVEWDANNYCNVESLVRDNKAHLFNVHELHNTPAPEFDIYTQDIREIEPLLVNDLLTQQWEVFQLSEEQFATKEEHINKSLEEKIFALWSAADKYTSNYVSGVAIGILTIGVLQQLPKAMAVNNWSRNIWTEYYIRKSQVTVSSVDNHDFSSFGPMPHTVPELQEELGL